MNTNQHPADQLGMLLAQVAELTKQADAIKAQLKDTATSGGATVFEGTFFKSTFVEANRNVVDYKSIVADLCLTDDYVAKFTSVTAVFSIKTTSR